MRSSLRLIPLTMLGAAAVLLPACDGLFEDVYDNGKTDSAQEVIERDGFGFVRIDGEHHSGRIYLNAISYTRWTYVNLHALTTDSLDLSTDPDASAEILRAGEPAEWDFAIHRYDLKTNGGEGMETAFTSLDDVAALTTLPEGEWHADTWTTDRITIDMSHMMDGYLIYLPSYVNTEISRWLDVDLSTMPPIYTTSNRVYLLRMADGTVAALRLVNYMNDRNVKGYMTIDYIYPLL